MVLLVGIMSDSHDDLKSIRDATSFFNDAEVDLVLHAGDLTAPGVIVGFQELKAPLKLVWGNNEGDKVTLKTWFEKRGFEVLGYYGDLNLEGKRVFMLHGINETVVKALANMPDIDVVVRGHTHRKGITQEKALVINPGEVGGLLTGRRTIATLKLPEMKAEIHEI